MYYITKKTTKTGKKFQAITEKAKRVNSETKKLITELGATHWRPKAWAAWGGISAMRFKEKPDLNIYKEVMKGEFMPRRNTKAGKELSEKIKALPVVEKHDLNLCIGATDLWPYSIGFAKGKTHFGFITSDEWSVKIPKDCIEVTRTKYNQLFRIK